MEHSESFAKHTGRPVTRETLSSLPSAYPALLTTEWCVCEKCRQAAMEFSASLALLQALPEPKVPPDLTFRQILHEREAQSVRRRERKAKLFAHLGFTYLMLVLLLTPVLLAIALVSFFTGGPAWIWLLLGVIPYHVRLQRRVEGEKIVVRALFWSLAVGMSSQSRQSQPWSLRIPAVESMHSLIKTRT